MSSFSSQNVFELQCTFEHLFSILWNAEAILALATDRGVRFKDDVDRCVCAQLKVHGLRMRRILLGLHATALACVFRVRCA